MKTYKHYILLQLKEIEMFRRDLSRSYEREVEPRDALRYWIGSTREKQFQLKYLKHSRALERYCDACDSVGHELTAEEVDGLINLFS